VDKRTRARELAITLPGSEQEVQAEKDYKGIDYPEKENPMATELFQRRGIWVKKL